MQRYLQPLSAKLSKSQQNNPDDWSADTPMTKNSENVLVLQEWLHSHYLNSKGGNREPVIENISQVATSATLSNVGS